jgi:GNAT superfamily N-acetyltransferase
MPVNIRPITDADPLAVSAAFTAAGWTMPTAKFERYAQMQQAGQRVVLIAELDGRPCGYLTIVWQPDYAYRPDRCVPEIQDFNVVPPLQRQGIGSALMDEAERIVGERSDEIGIGVGLHPGYGTAQRLYVRRGYVPDGRGVAYRNATVAAGQSVVNDDDLVLHFRKRLR